MPGFDRTGPEGQGPMTGRELGKCNSENKRPPDKDQHFRPGKGIGHGRGRGRGRHGRGTSGCGRGLN